MKKKLIILFLVGLLIVVFWQWDLLVYGMKMARGQWKIIRQSRPVEEVLKDPAYPDSIKTRLRLAQEVRRFAIDSLGLYNSDNYTTFYDQQGKPILWNLSAAEPFELKPYTWYFPFLGSMPYKGFFDLPSAMEEKAELDTQGYDTRVRTVGGWSTLGILSDPILSNMLERSEGALAEVIIHELTHATIFVKDEIEFNENLASFIGEEGARLFLQYKYGAASDPLREYIEKEADYKTYTRHILKGSKILDSLYATFTNEQSKEQKQMLKEQTIREIINQLDSLDFHSQRYYQLFDSIPPNNAYFMAHKRYHSQEDSLKNIYLSHNQNLPAMIDAMKALYEK